MRVGAEDRRKLIAAIVLVALAALAAYSLLARPQTPAAAAAAAPAVRPQPRRQPAKRAAARPAQPAPESLDPTLRLSLLHASEDVKYEGTGRNIFRAQAEEELPKAVKSPLEIKKELAQKQAQQGPPPPPPINLKFYGFANTPGAAKKRVFLSEGDNIFIAAEGDVVNRRYRVVKIGQNSVEIEDLLNNNRQNIPLIQS